MSYSNFLKLRNDILFLYFSSISSLPNSSSIGYFVANFKLSSSINFFTSISSMSFLKVMEASSGNFHSLSSLSSIEQSLSYLYSFDSPNILIGCFSTRNLLQISIFCLSSKISFTSSIGVSTLISSYYQCFNFSSLCFAFYSSHSYASIHSWSTFLTHFSYN